MLVHFCVNRLRPIKRLPARTPCPLVTEIGRSVNCPSTHHAQTLDTSSLYTLYSVYTLHILSTLYINCTHIVQTLYTYSVHFVHIVHILFTLCTHCTHTLYTMYTLYTYSVHYVHTVHILCTLCTYCLFNKTVLGPMNRCFTVLQASSVLATLINRCKVVIALIIVQTMALSIRG